MTEISNSEEESVLKEELKQSIKKYYLEGDMDGLKEAYSIIGNLLGIEPHKDTPSDSDEVRQFIDYCKSMKMSYSYKAVLLLLLIDTPELSCQHFRCCCFFQRFLLSAKD